MSTLLPLREQYHGLLTHVTRVFDGIDETLASTRPIPGRWSMAECIAHLNVTGAPYLERLDMAMAEGPGRHARHMKMPGIVNGLFIRWLEPPYRMKVKTFTQFEPQGNTGLDETLRTFERQQHDFLQLIDRLEQDGVPRRRITSPVQPLLRMHADSWLHFLAAHARRHLWQAEQVQRECRG